MTFIFIQVLVIHHTNLQTFYTYSTQLWHQICERFKIVETAYHQNQFCLSSNDIGFVYDGVGIGETTGLIPIQVIARYTLRGLALRFWLERVCHLGYRSTMATNTAACSEIICHGSLLASLIWCVKFPPQKKLLVGRGQNLRWLAKREREREPIPNAMLSPPECFCI